MRHIQRTVRLPIELDATLSKLASAQQTTPYAILQKSVRVGLKALTAEAAISQTITDIASEIGTISASQAHAERLLERAIFVSTAAYCYARASVGGRIPDTTIVEEINSAHLRQLKIAEGEDA